MTIGSTLTKCLIKGSGIAALGVTAYDSHIMGNLHADMYAKSKDADACADAFNNTQYLSSPSPTTAKLKKEVLNVEMESNIRHFINSGIGYFKGFISTLVNNVVPLGLGIGALASKGKIAKGCAIGLRVYAACKFFKDILGFGHYNDLNSKF